MAKASVPRVEPEVTLTLSANEARWLKSMMQNPLPLVPLPAQAGAPFPSYTLPSRPEDEDPRDRKHRTAIFEALNEIDELK